MSHHHILYSVNEYDIDGSVITFGIYLHFGETRIKVADNLKDFKIVAEQINAMIPEVIETYKASL